MKTQLVNLPWDVTMQITDKSLNRMLNKSTYFVEKFINFTGGENVTLLDKYGNFVTLLSLSDINHGIKEWIEKGLGNYLLHGHSINISELDQNDIHKILEFATTWHYSS